MADQTSPLHPQMPIPGTLRIGKADGGHQIGTSRELVWKEIERVHQTGKDAVGGQQKEKAKKQRLEGEMRWNRDRQRAKGGASERKERQKMKKAVKADDVLGR